MKALVYEGSRQLRLREFREPRAETGEVIVQVAAVGVCGSDLTLFRDGHAAVATPRIPGHEFGGRLENGDFVVVNPFVGCRECRACSAGRTHLCARRRLLGFTRDGAYAERVAVPRHNLVAAPSLTAVQAALVEPIANGVHAWHRCGRPTGSVAIIGAGSIGMCLLHVLRRQGLTEITMVDPVPDRLDSARAAGASAVATRLAGEFEAVFDAAGTESTRADALRCVLPGGTVALVGLHDDRLSASATQLIVGDRTLAGCFAYTEPEFADAVGHAATIDAPWAQDILADDAEPALASLIAGQPTPGRIKTVIRFGS